MQLTIGRRLMCGFAAVMVLVGLMFVMTNRATRDLREAHRQLGDAVRDSARVQVEAATLDRWSEALGKARATFVLQVLRQVVLFFPMLILLPRVMGVDGVWLSFPFMDLTGFLLALWMLRAEMKRWSQAG